MSQIEGVADLFANDHNGRGLKQITEELFEMQTAIKKKMDSGLTKDEMTKARQVLDAVETAKEVANAIHAKYNN